jgi:Ca2+-binding EF-hand superfamily protein
MQRRTKLFIALGAVGLLGLSAADMAFADRGRGHHGYHNGYHGDHARRGHHGKMRHRIRAFTERYDTNRDGRVMQEEIDANRTEWVREFDANNDGQLSLEEFQNLWLRARFERMVREFQRFDRNGDAQVTLEEYREPLSDLVERLDRNDDGALSRDDRSRRGMKERRGGGDEQNQAEPQDGETQEQ